MNDCNSVQKIKKIIINYLEWYSKLYHDKIFDKEVIIMLIREKLENGQFSYNERLIIDFILKEKSNIKDMTTKEIAKATYTSASTLVRLAQKMNFKGWNELKDAYLKEEDYLQSHFCNIDANYPFQNNDTIMSIASKIAILKKESIDDTLSLITHDDLQKAIQMIRKASSVTVFATSNNLYSASQFKHNMGRIQKLVNISSIQGETVYSAYTCDMKTCALMISYSGETEILRRAIYVLKNKGIPTIAITNIGDNTISRLADCVLKITTREKLYSKIATFSTDSAISYLLDVIYSCIFALDYDNNKKSKLQMSKMIEIGRFSTLDIIKEDDE